MDLTPYQLITAASIDVKEGEYQVNMPKVARVIFNRLASWHAVCKDGFDGLVRLGTRWGFCDTGHGREIQSPYNTYLNNGLTPTPICTVSTQALRAVLNAPQAPGCISNSRIRTAKRRSPRRSPTAGGGSTRQVTGDCRELASGHCRISGVTLTLSAFCTT